MEVPSLAGGKDKQPIAAPEPHCMTLRTGVVQENGPKASISSALHHLARFQCQNYCLLAFIFNDTRDIQYVTLKSLTFSLEMTSLLEIQLRQSYTSHITVTRQKTLNNQGASTQSSLLFLKNLDSFNV